MTEQNATEAVNPAIEEVKNTEPLANDNADSKDGEPKEVKKPWFQKRFDRFTAQNSSLSRQLESALTELANLRAGKTEEGAVSSLPEAEIDRRATLKAEEIADLKLFNQRCDAVYQTGLAEFDDFSPAIDVLKGMGVMTKDFLELTTELDNPHKILHYLGNNPDEADRIQSLPSAKQALALAKLEGSLGKTPEKPVSKAPAPVKAVDGKSGDKPPYASKYYEGMQQQEYNDWRDKTGRKR